MNPPFAIGDEIVRTQPDTYNVIQKGQKFNVLDIWYCCEEFGWRVDIGVNPNPKSKCGCGRPHRGNNFWHYLNFRKIEKNHDDAIFEILEKFKQTDEKPDVIKIKELI